MTALPYWHELPEWERAAIVGDVSRWSALRGGHATQFAELWFEALLPPHKAELLRRLGRLKAVS